MTNMANEILSDLTRVNPLLSRLTMDAFGLPEGSAINCTDRLALDVATYIRDSLAPNTRKALSLSET